jgi:hypothetical protein
VCVAGAGNIETVAEGLLLSKPYVYDSNLPAALSRTFPRVNSVLQRDFITRVRFLPVFFLHCAHLILTMAVLIIEPDRSTGRGKEHLHHSHGRRSAVHLLCQEREVGQGTCMVAARRIYFLRWSADHVHRTQDLWSELVAPKLKTSLLIETWMNGATSNKV